MIFAVPTILLFPDLSCKELFSSSESEEKGESLDMIQVSKT